MRKKCEINHIIRFQRVVINIKNNLNIIISTIISQNSFVNNENSTITFVKNAISNSIIDSKFFIISFSNLVKNVSTIISQIVFTFYSQYYVFFQISNFNIILNENVQNVIKNVVNDKVEKFIFSLFTRSFEQISSKTKNTKNFLSITMLLSMHDNNVFYILRNISILNISNFARNISQLFDK